MVSTQRARKLRFAGQVPADYSGPIYYRIIEKNSGPPYFTDKIEADAETRERTRPFWDPSIRLQGAAVSRLLLDEHGELRSEWIAPLKYDILQDRPLSFEYMPGGFTSQRVHDVIIALDPGRHIFLPVDARWPDGRTERYYNHQWADDSFFAETSFPVLHPTKNEMEVGTYISGENFFKHPDWIMGRDAALNPFHFGYLNREFIGDLDLFKTSVLDNAVVLSDTLMTELKKLGNPFWGADTYVRMGVA